VGLALAYASIDLDFRFFLKNAMMRLTAMASGGGSSAVPFSR